MFAIGFYPFTFTHVNTVVLIIRIYEYWTVFSFHKEIEEYPHGDPMPLFDPEFEAREKAKMQRAVKHMLDDTAKDFDDEEEESSKEKLQAAIHGDVHAKTANKGGKADGHGRLGSKDGHFGSKPGHSGSKDHEKHVLHNKK